MTRLSTFIVHYSPLSERKKFLEENLPTQLDAVWVTEKDVARSITVPMIKWTSSRDIFGLKKRVISVDLRTNIKSNVMSRRLAYIESQALSLLSYIPGFPSHYRYGGIPRWEKVPLPALEVTTMHYEAIRRSSISESSWTLVLEDDAVPNGDVVNRILEITNKLNTNKPIWINLNSGVNLKRTKSDKFPDELGLFRVKPPSTRCAVAYLTNRSYVDSAIQLFSKYPLPDWLGIDFIYQVVNRKIGAKSFWTEPVLFLQGSETGLYKSNQPAPE